MVFPTRPAIIQLPLNVVFRSYPTKWISLPNTKNDCKTASWDFDFRAASVSYWFFSHARGQLHSLIKEQTQFVQTRHLWGLPSSLARSPLGGTAHVVVLPGVNIVNFKCPQLADSFKCCHSSSSSLYSLVIAYLLPPTGSTYPRKPSTGEMLNEPASSVIHSHKHRP